MNPELESLLKAWDAYLQAATGRDAEQLLAVYEAELQTVCERTRVRQDLLDRAVQRAYQRWQWADDPRFPRTLRKTKLD